MAMVTKPEKRTARGKVRFENNGNGKALAVHVDRQGFRRLLETLERLATTGESQTFGKSGRSQTKSVSEVSGRNVPPAKIVFHIDDD